MPSINNEKIKKDCPRCGCEKETIELWNCGPIVYVQCPKCRFRLTDGVDSVGGVDNMFAAWNNIYLPKEKELFHVHTYRCKHAGEYSDEEYVKYAIGLGTEKLTFTDHAPFPGDRFTHRMAYSQLPEYIDSLKELKKKYEAQIQIGIGLEIEYLPSFKGYYEELKSNTDLDFLMVGQHMYEINENLFSYELDSSQGDVLFPRLAESLIEGIDSGFFSVVAHPDRVFKTQTEWNNEMDRLSRQIIRNAIENNMLLEINEESKTSKTHFWNEFWETVDSFREEYGQKVRTIHGLDAHAPDELKFIPQK